MFFARRTADPELALDLWAETFAQAVAGRRRHRGRSDEETAAWLYAIARRQLALYYRRGYAKLSTSSSSGPANDCCCCRSRPGA